MYGIKWIAALALVAALGTKASAETVTLFDGHQLAAILTGDERPLQLAGDVLAHDLQAVTGMAPQRASNKADCRTVCIVIGRYDSPLIRAIAEDAGVAIDTAALKGQWERYERLLVASKRDPRQRYLILAGSDTRGAIWGAMDLTRALGVSPWQWWADVPPRKRDYISVDGTLHLSDVPSVRYRGIFLNDEDWGLQPWAAKTYEPETGDIGPKTYARIFELLWRLKANLIWPAMHDSTRPFYQVKGNAETARDYAIVVGTSHAEPMMRNNVREWDEQQRGAFNFFTNREALTTYWRQRVTEVKDFDTIYSIGLRGKHDSAMEGAATPEAARDALSEVFKIQRGLLADTLHKPPDTVPQVLTLYKEVLDTYRAGLKVPQDVTLIWPDDNYGYISELSTPQENKRPGGSGVYYHISYWGRPHDYLWLATTHPALIREQMERAWQMGARNVWVVNVGDIKPGEYLTDYFLSLAFDQHIAAQSPQAHLNQWAALQFGPEVAAEIAAIMTEYYDLAFERRPEFMGFSQTEPTRPNVISAYIRSGGAEAQNRLERYAALTRRAEALDAQLKPGQKDAYFQLVLYPVRAAASLNERVLKLDLAALYAKQGRANVNFYVDQARAAHARIVADTARYNSLNGGKWRYMMDMAPRRLPVFDEPLYPHWNLPDRPGCAVDSGELIFVAGLPATHSLTVYSFGQPAPWHFSGVSGLQPAADRGMLNAANGFEQRVALHYDGGADLQGGSVMCAGKSYPVTVQRIKAADGAVAERNHIISLAAVGSTSAAWQVMPGLGSRGTALRSRLDLPTSDNVAGIAPLVYSFNTRDKTDAMLDFVGLPVHPLTSANGLRIGIRIDGGALQILDFETFGRSEEWKRNVLSNTAVRTVVRNSLPAGRHRLEVYALDPGFVLDRIDVWFDGAPEYYGAPPLYLQ